MKHSSSTDCNVYGYGLQLIQAVNKMRYKVTSWVEISCLYLMIFVSENVREFVCLYLIHLNRHPRVKNVMFTYKI